LTKKLPHDFAPWRWFPPRAIQPQDGGSSRWKQRKSLAPERFSLLREIFGLVGHIQRLLK